MEKRIVILHRFAERPTKGVLPPVLVGLFVQRERGKIYFEGDAEAEHS